MLRSLRRRVSAVHSNGRKRACSESASSPQHRLERDALHAALPKSLLILITTPAAASGAARLSQQQTWPASREVRECTSPDENLGRTIQKCNSEWCESGW